LQKEKKVAPATCGIRTAYNGHSKTAETSSDVRANSDCELVI